jgi:hypothetical protein
MGAGNVEFTAYSHATAAKKLLRSGSLVSRHTNGLPAEELEALSKRGCRATAGSYRTDEKNCSRIRLVDLAELFIELYRPRPASCIPQFPPTAFCIARVVLKLDQGNF